MADRTGAAGDQNGLSRDRPVAKQAAPRGHAGDAERRTGGKGNVLGYRRHQIIGQRDIFRRGTEGAAVALAVEQPDTVADGKPRHAIADLIDDSCAVAVGDHAWKFHSAIAAAAAADIGGVGDPRPPPDPGLPPAPPQPPPLARRPPPRPPPPS